MTTEPAAGSRPNIVLIVTDQHRSDHAGFGGNRIVRTPRLDRLAGAGTRFTSAYAANPVCMPNRATILTGRMPSAHGTRFNGISLDRDANTFVRELRRAGYRTGLVGKAHFQNMGHGAGALEVARRAWPVRAAVAPRYEDGWDLLENDERHRESDVELPDDFYGFGHVELAIGHGDVVSGHYLRWLVAHGLDPTAVQGPQNSAERYAPWWQVWRPTLPEELYPTHWVGERAMAFIGEAARSAAPFFLQVSFPDPHHPFTPPGRYHDMYDPADTELPPTFADDHATSMPHLQALRARRGEQPPRHPAQPFAPTEEILRTATAKEYGSITCIDGAIGAILDALEAAAVADRTVVIFTSDHAEMFGDHGLMLKGAMHYRPALRVPLLVRDPRRPSQPAVVDSLVGSIDLAQTLLALAGLDAYAGMQGHSLLPMLDDPSLSVRNAILVEEDEPFDLARTGSPLRMRTLITRLARLTLYAGTERGELFDVVDDPDELCNRWSDAGARALRGELCERLASAMMAADDAGMLPSSFA